MSKKEIQLLEKQIEKLDTKDFDLEAWKKYTIIILARIFGDKNQKITQVEKLEYEFSSWSLRDASGNESYEAGTKKLAREILQAAIDELKVFGIPEIESDQAIQEFLNILLDELKGSQVKQLKSILASRESKDEKQRKLKEILEGIGEYGAYSVLTSMLMHKAAMEIIKK